MTKAQDGGPDTDDRAGSDHDLESGQVLDTASSTGDSASLHSGDDDVERRSISHISTHVSLGPDNPADHYSSYVEVPDAVFERFSNGRKLVIVTLLSYLAFLAPISSTTVLAAVPEVAEQYDTSGSIVNLSNAMYMLFMGVSPMVWGPLMEVYGRKPISTASSFLFFACSIGTAAAPNLAAFFVFRILTAVEGTAFLIVGSACIGDIYRPTERATAMGWFLSGTLIGPAFGPFIGGIIVTYTSWRVIFWLQAGLAGMACLGTFFLLPETIHHKKIDDLEGYSRRDKVKVFWRMVNPMRVIRLFRYPNLILIGIASSSLIWNMYSLLTPIRYVLNPRFHLTTPMQSGLFYLAPGCGYVVGTFGGGRFADYVVKREMKAKGQRIPEDRMRSALPFMGVVIPACVLIYGWSVEKAVGGIPLAVITLFIQGVAQLFCFPSLNTYCLDVMQSRGAEVIAGNYFIRYLFACAGTAVVLPAVEAIGVGWFSTISAIFLIASSIGTWATIAWGKQWRDNVDQKKRAKRVAERQRVREQLREQGERAAQAEAAAAKSPAPATAKDEKSTSAVNQGVLSNDETNKKKEEAWRSARQLQG